MEALAQVGGLSTNTADPTGIFLLREEPEFVARKVLGQPGIQGSQQIAYMFNLTEGSGIFAARNFVIRDEDTIYVTEAPISQFNKARAWEASDHNHTVAATTKAVRQSNSWFNQPPAKNPTMTPKFTPIE